MLCRITYHRKPEGGGLVSDETSTEESIRGNLISYGTLLSYEGTVPNAMPQTRKPQVVSEYR